MSMMHSVSYGRLSNIVSRLISGQSLLQYQAQPSTACSIARIYFAYC